MIYLFLLYLLGFLPAILQLIILIALGVFSTLGLKHLKSEDLDCVRPLIAILLIQFICKFIFFCTGYYTTTGAYWITLILVIFMIIKFAHKFGTFAISCIVIALMIFGIRKLLLPSISSNLLPFNLGVPAFIPVDVIAPVIIFIISLFIVRKQLGITKWRFWVCMIIGIAFSLFFDVYLALEVTFLIASFILFLEKEDFTGILHFFKFLIIGLFFAYIIELIFAHILISIIALLVFRFMYNLF